MHLGFVQKWIKISDSVDLDPILAMSTDSSNDLHEWAYGDWSAEDAVSTTWDMVEHDNNGSLAWDLKFKARELGFKYSQEDLLDLMSFEERLDEFYNEKKKFAQSMARALKCPYTDKDLAILNIKTFIKQLLGIQRANVLAIRMGVGPIEFTI